MQWLIDLIQEWVIAQGYATIAYVDAEIATLKAWVIAQVYATEAWVLEWVEPVHVTGTLDPDATCTYHKGGTHNGLPYYIRDDGAYYIWWDGSLNWYITTTLGVIAQPAWKRTNPGLIGLYPPVAPTTGIATVTSGYGCLKLHYVDRGSLAAYDFAVGNYTQDGAWHDLDLSGIVPANVSAVCIELRIRSVNVGKNLEFKPSYHANDLNACSLLSQVANINITGRFITQLDSTRKIKYRASAAGFNRINTSILGWWL